ncbi:hypothetical protein TIFTF001_053842, partial [Ficus carica]
MKMLLFELTLNVMMRTIAGKRYYGESVAEVEEARTFQDIVKETFRMGTASNISDFLPFMKLLGTSDYEKKLIELQRKRDDFMQYLIEEHRKNMGKIREDRMKTMSEVLLKLQESEPDYYTDDMIRGLLLVLFSAGTDTSAGTMEWALSLLLNHPEVMEKACAELENCVGHDRLVDESDLNNLPYLQCIIKETMRLFPAGPLLIPHESSEECKMNPTSFKPGRFKDVEGMKYGFKYIPFGTGRRGCPGENFAVRIVGLNLGLLIQCFEWERLGKEL